MPISGAWAGWLAALEANGVATAFMLRPGAKEAAIVALEAVLGVQLPEEARALYVLADGQADVMDVASVPPGKIATPLFGGFEFNSLERIAYEWTGWREIRDQHTPEQLAEDFDDSVEVRAGDPVKKHYTHQAWIPFATDGGGNSLALDLAPEPGGTVGQIIVIGSDEDLRRVLAPGLTAFLEQLTDKLRSGEIAIGEPENDGAPIVFFGIE